MKIYVINGSPRKGWNTGTMLENVVKGAESVGAEAVRYDLYDLDYKGCMSCFACKMKASKNYGRCARQDGITPILQGIEKDADAVVLGSPIYWGGMNGETRSFMERLLFAPVVYNTKAPTRFPRKIRSAFIYTMNNPEERSRAEGYNAMFDMTASRFQLVFGGKSEVICAYDTCQFPDYSKVEMNIFDPAHKAARRIEALPEDCRKAFELGRRLATPENQAESAAGNRAGNSFHE
jgi:multimeric flavodoxin WrbA